MTETQSHRRRRRSRGGSRKHKGTALGDAGVPWKGTRGLHGVKDPSGVEAQGAGRPRVSARQGCLSTQETLPVSSPTSHLPPMRPGRVVGPAWKDKLKGQPAALGVACLPRAAHSSCAESPDSMQKLRPLWGPLSVWLSDCRCVSCWRSAWKGELGEGQGCLSAPWSVCWEEPGCISPP